jgi:hypothetical protein
MPNASEMMVIDTVEEIAPGVVEVDEYVVEAGNRPSEQLGGAPPAMPGGSEEE